MTTEKQVLGDLPPNAALPNMREITEGELAQSHFFTYSSDWQGYRQILPANLPEGIDPPLSGGRPCIMAVRYWGMFDRTGYAVYADYWGQKLRWFKWAVCEHTMVHTSRDGNCLNTYTCSKCGFSRVIDSSD